MNSYDYNNRYANARNDFDNELKNRILWLEQQVRDLQKIVVELQKKK